jgi:hypothetical protein
MTFERRRCEAPATVSGAHPAELAFCSPILQGEPTREGRATWVSSRSVRAGVRPGVGRPVIGAIKPVAVIAATNKTTPSCAEVLVADMRHARAKTSDATAAKATHLAATKAATHVTSAKAPAHMAAATATVSSAATAAACLRTGGKKAAGQHRACQDHHHSSSHHILLWNGRAFRHRVWSDAGMSEQGNRQRDDTPEMGMLTRALH